MLLQYPSRQCDHVTRKQQQHCISSNRLASPRQKLSLMHVNPAVSQIPHPRDTAVCSSRSHSCSRQPLHTSCVMAVHRLRRIEAYVSSGNSSYGSRSLQQKQQEVAQQPQQQQQQQHQPWQQWLARQGSLFAGTLLLGALLALTSSNRRTAALAATLPAHQVTTDAMAASSNSMSSRKASSSHSSYTHQQHASQQAVTQPKFSLSSSAAATSAPPSSTATVPSPAPAFPDVSSNSSSASSSSNNNSNGTAAIQQLLAHERATVHLFGAACPSVVNITHMRAMQNFYTLDIHRMAVGQGSGFIWDKAGHVVTNYHVIKGAAEVKVTLFDHSSCTARVVGSDPAKDIAVLKLALPRSRLDPLQPVTLGSSDALKVGQSVYALGNPFGLDHTLTQGIVSGLGRELSSGLSAIKGVIQTDCAINPGNSGGVLLNSQGQVVGVNLGILDPSGKGAFSGVGFATPIDTVKGLVEQILAHGRVRRPTLGITIAPEQVLAQLGTEGVLVLEVPAGTPAAAAGLRATYRDVFGDIVLGDIIVGMDTRPIRSVAEFIAALDERRPGDKVRCDVLRDGKRLSMTVTLGERGMYCE